MASSYTTNYGIEKIGSGEQSGAWGTTTNHNLDLLDRIASYKAVALSGTTHTLTVREASPGSGTENLQDGMFRVVKFTGALGANNTVTIAPNTTTAYFIIINATTDSGSSGPYSVILSQGSGANITVENGKSAIVYCDGAGSGAAVADALSNLALATLTTSGAITATGDVTTSGTFNALGDTAASDKAAVGYTSAEGLILTGQGSTNDVTIKNDADADVITIATGGTNVDIVGDVTASTVNADGDTAASDNAAMGYTSAEGLILTGQGSTNDVTIKNDADTAVLTISTGSTAVDIVGDVTASTVNADGDTAAGDDAAMGWTSAEGLILTGQGSTSDITIKNDADTAVLTIATGTTNVDIVGDVTASTVNADGDTAAGDDAAMGYTSAEGLILTGQGSTSDITIKNDADAAVLTVATGTTNVDVVGDLTAATLNADGDTAAGDNAAIGYTDSEGLILTGQGSTNDITIKNDADAEVCTIKTGTTTFRTEGVLSIADGSNSAPSISFWNDPDTGIMRIGGNEATFVAAGSNGLASWGSYGLRIKNGSAGTPSLGLLSDTDSGIFSGGAGQVNISTGGSERVGVDSNGDFRPGSDNAYSCGLSGSRWDVVYAADGTINTSDENEKEDIIDEPLGLAFINAIRPVQFKWKDRPEISEVREIEEYDEDGEVTGNTIEKKYVAAPAKKNVRPHHGMIAQEIKAVLTDLSIDFAGYIDPSVTGDDGPTGLRYSEFISPIIKAIQELSDRIDALEG